MDELAAGYRRQFAGRTTVDVGYIHRDYRDRPALVETNAIYDGNVFRGYRNEAQNDIFLLTTNEWNYPVYNALEILATKQTSQFQLLGSFTRSWSHLEGTWQPRDPASFIQPDAFLLNRGMELNDNRVASSNNGLNPGTGGAEWTELVVRFAAVYHAPWKFNVATNYALQGRRWSGPIITRVAAADPQFGPTTVTLSNGRIVPNPLATLNRFAFPTRDEGQFKLPALHVINLRDRPRFRLPAGAPPPDRRRFLQPREPRSLPGIPGGCEPTLQHQLWQGRGGAAAVQLAGERPVLLLSRGASPRPPPPTARLAKLAEAPLRSPAAGPRRRARAPAAALTRGS